MNAIRPWCLLGLALLVGGCEKQDPAFVQGYVEGEFVHVASPSAGQLIRLSVERGSEVKKGDPLFEIDPTPLRTARDEAAHRVEQAEATLRDARTGQRPEEIAGLQAQLDQAKAAAEYSRNQAERLAEARANRASAEADVDLAKSRMKQDEERVVQLQENLKVAKLGARDAQVEAAAQELRARQAALEAAEWQLAEASQSAPEDAVVNDLVYQNGDWVAAGKPVVVLLPPANIKVRAFVPEGIVGQIHVGDEASVHVDGSSETIKGKVGFISPRAEFTPPVIFSQKMRAKFVFMIELEFDRDAAAGLHPGQPVDVRFKLP